MSYILNAANSCRFNIAVHTSTHQVQVGSFGPLHMRRADTSKIDLAISMALRSLYLGGPTKWILLAMLGAPGGVLGVVSGSPQRERWLRRWTGHHGSYDSGCRLPPTVKILTGSSVTNLQRTPAIDVRFRIETHTNGTCIESEPGLQSL